MKFCAKCGKELMDDAVLCPHCGCTVDGAPAKKVKSESSQSAKSGWVPLVFGILGLVYGILYLIWSILEPFEYLSIITFLFQFLTDLCVGLSGILAIIYAIPLLNKKNVFGVIGFCFGVISIILIAISTFLYLRTYYEILY